MAKAQVEPDFVITDDVIDDADLLKPWIHVVNVNSDVRALVVDVISDVSFDLLLWVCAVQFQLRFPCFVVFIIAVSLAKLEFIKKNSYNALFITADKYNAILSQKCHLSKSQLSFREYS